MPGLPSQKQAILEHMKSGKLSAAVVKFDQNLGFKSPSMNNYKYSDQTNLKENAEVTRQVAAEGTILLK
jgi:beta-glucosidase